MTSTQTVATYIEFDEFIERIEDVLVLELQTPVKRASVQELLIFPIDIGVFFPMLFIQLLVVPGPYLQFLFLQ